MPATTGYTEQTGLIARLIKDVRRLQRQGLNTLRDVDPTGLAKGAVPTWDGVSKFKVAAPGEAGSSILVPWKDAFTVAAAPSATYTLTYLPVAHSMNLSLNGIELLEGSDYTVSSATGVISLSSDVRSQLVGTGTADVLTADYDTTGTLAGSAPSGSADTQWSISGGTAVNVSSVDAVALIDSGVPFSDVDGNLTPGTGDCDLVFGSSGPLTAADNGSFLFLRCNSSLGGLWRFDRASGVDNDTRLATIAALNSGGSFSVSASGSTLTIKQGTTTLDTLTLDTSDAALLTQTYVGIRGSHGTGAVVDSFSANGGTVADAFNRPDSVTLGVADTGQTWLGNR